MSSTFRVGLGKWAVHFFCRPIPLPLPCHSRLRDAPLKDFDIPPAPLFGGGCGGSAARAASGESTATTSGGTATASVRPDLFLSSAVYLGLFCHGPATLVVSMEPGCKVAAEADVLGALPP